MTIEYRVFGPPGTGKTTVLATKYIPDAVGKYGEDKIMVTSFTRAAACEIAGRNSADTPIPEYRVGTLHKICYHALGRPEIAEASKESLAQWNEQNPGLAITGANVSSIDEGGSADPNGPASPGDRLFNLYKILRNRMVPEDKWPPDVAHFGNLWRAHKNITFASDFTDLIETCLHNFERAPGEPAVIFVDEAQDMTRLQMTLVRRWAEHAEYLVICGDDDQNLYSWAGTSADVMIHPPVPAERKRILKQSYRVPRAVLERASEIVKRISVREPKDYMPKNLEGEVRELQEGSWRKPEAVIDLAEEIARDGKTVMILGSCQYMLEPAAAVMKSRGVPFENKYRRSNAAWNPLYRAPRVMAKSAIGVLRSFLSVGPDAPYWTVPALLQWIHAVKVGDAGRKRNSKQLVSMLEEAVQKDLPGLHTAREVLPHLLAPEGLQHALERNLDWLYDNLKSDKAKTLEYPMRVVERHGTKAIHEPPKITLGTIHSVKGGEADAVFLFPDISYQAEIEMQTSQDGRDAVHRMFYVGMTRAAESLFLCRPAAKNGQARLFVNL